MHTTTRLITLLLCMPAAGLPARAAQLASEKPVAPAPAPAAPVDNGGDDKDLSPTRLKFSDPAKPGKIRLRAMWGDVTITGADTPEVTIVSNIKNKQQPPPKNSGGLRRLDSEITYTATEKDNVDHDRTGWRQPGPDAGAGGASLAITTPRNTSVVIENTFGGTISVKNIEGDADIRSLNGEVTLDRISGSALVETMNGEIHATFVKVAEGKPLSFTSMNGEVEVRIPPDTKANVRLRTQNGAVFTDFDEKALVTKTEATRGKLTTHIRVPHNPDDHPDNSGWHDEIRDAVREATQAGARGGAGGRRGCPRGRPGRPRRRGRSPGHACPRPGAVPARAAVHFRWQGRKRHAQWRRSRYPDRNDERHHHPAQNAAVMGGWRGV